MTSSTNTFIKLNFEDGGICKILNIHSENTYKPYSIHENSSQPMAHQSF